jgi:hypothetical protein
MWDLAYEFQGVYLPQDFDFEDMCMRALSYVFEEFHLLRALKVERLQLGTIAVWQWNQISDRLGPVWIHVEAETTTGEKSGQFKELG